MNPSPLKYARSILLTAALGGIQPMFAQYHDLKVNVGGLLFRRYGGAYEFGFGEYWGVQLHYLRSENGITWRNLIEENVKTTGDQYTLEARYYSWPNEESDGLYSGVYVRYLDATYQGTTEEFAFPQGLVEESYSFRSRGWAIGITGGTKVITVIGLMVEVNAGVGYYAVLNRSEVIGEPLEEEFFDRMEFRVGLALGWRFESPQ